MKSITLAFVKAREILSYMNAAKFASEYLPHIPNFKYKLSGRASNGKEIDFTDAEKELIIEAVAKFNDDIKATKRKKAKPLKQPPPKKK